MSHVLMSMSPWRAMFQLDPSMGIQCPYLRLTCPPNKCPGRVFLEALRLVDEVDLALIFSRRAVVMKSVPKFMQGVFRVAGRAALEEVTAVRLVRDERRHTRAWKLFLLLPRLLLFRPPRGGLIPRKRLEERCALCARGDWTVFLAASECSVEAGAVASARRRRRGENGDVKRANRALQLVRMGELSAARQALEVAESLTLCRP